jgi:hypothetical protein
MSVDPVHLVFGKADALTGLMMCVCMCCCLVGCCQCASKWRI